MILYLEAMGEAGDLRLVPVWKAHLLTGDRKGTWSLHVTRNWRMTFRIDNTKHEIHDVNFEDYH
jgi:proteic killer suppression protein